MQRSPNAVVPLTVLVLVLVGAAVLGAEIQVTNAPYPSRTRIEGV